MPALVMVTHTLMRSAITGFRIIMLMQMEILSERIVLRISRLFGPLLRSSVKKSQNVVLASSFRILAMVHCLR
jgi:hypothetical protein